MAEGAPRGVEAVAGAEEALVALEVGDVYAVRAVAPAALDDAS